MPITIASLPPLHTGRDGKSGQQLIADCPARFIVCICGRRFGKTVLGVWKCIKGALEGSNGIYWWVGPNYPEIQASRAWPILKELVNQIPGSIVREADRYVTLPNGSEIWIKSAENEDSLRGGALDGVVLDEAAQLKEYLWDAVLNISLLDRGGWALFIGTPRGKNWLYRLFIRAKRKDWAAFKFTTFDNPYLSLERINAIVADTPPQLVQQEIYADFGASQNLVYPTFDRELNKWTTTVPEFVSYYGGLDFGGDSIGAHKSAGCIFGRTKDDILIIIKVFEQSGPYVGIRQMEWIQESELRLGKLNRKFMGTTNRVMWRADKTQMWGIQLARQEGIHISPSKGGRDSIREGIGLVQKRLQPNWNGKPGLYYLPECHQVPEAFERYKYPEYKDDEKVAAEKPLSVNDDLITSVRYGIEGIDFGAKGDPAQLFANQLARVI